MKKTYLIFLSLLCVNLLNAQIYELEIHFGNTQNCEIRGMDIDASGNIIVTGYFSQIVDFDPGPEETTLSGIGNSVGFIAKYDDDGKFIWVKMLETMSSFVPLELEVDGSDNIYITGSLNGSVDMDPSEGVQTVSSSVGYNGFYAKYNSDGDMQWAYRLPGPGYGLDLDSDNNVYITGQFFGSKYFVGVEPPNVADGSGDTFISKYNSDGTFQWVVQLGGSGNEIGYDLVVNSQNEIVTTGALSSAADFDPGAGDATLTNGGDQDAYVAKYDSDGNYVWAFNLGTMGTTTGKSVSIDSEDNVIVSGDFQNTIDADPGAGTENLVSEGSYDIFLAKYSTGGSYIWANSIGSNSHEYSYEVEVDNEDYIYLAGQLANGADLDPSAEIVTSYLGKFLANYTSDGSYNWYMHLGFINNSNVYELAVDGQNDVLIGGGLQVSGDLDPNDGYVPIHNISNSGTDALIAKYDKCILITNTVDEEVCQGEDVMFGTQTLTVSGQYMETFTAENGCDSLVTLNLTVNPVYDEDVSITVYEGGDYSFGAQTLTESGDYVETFSSINDCDSTVNLTLTISPFAGGSGTSEDPWEITSVSHLDEVRNYLDDYFVLLNDLDLSDATSDAGGAYYNGGLGWDPIDAFEGSFDGGGYTLEGLFIDRGSESDVGLFGSSFGGEFQNLVLVDVSINGLSNVGGLVGRAITNSSINSVGVRGIVNSVDGNVGGIVGFMVDSDMEQSYSSVSITATDASSANVGGLAGVLNSTGSLDLGIQDSYAFADLNGNDVVGGIAGATNSSKITNCYNSGFLSSQGSNFSELYGGDSNFTLVTDSYWNAEANCNINGGSTRSELQMQATYENWDFNTIWGIESGRLPHLQWQGMSEDHNNSAVSVASAISELLDVAADCQIEQPNPLPVIEACGVENDGVPDVSFPITAEGTTVVTWTFTDVFGRVETRTQNFTINSDDDAPVPDVAELPDVTGDCSTSIEDAPTAEDACEGTVVGVTDTTFPITAQGTTVVTWTFTDSNGNESTQTQNIIIDDNDAPVPEVSELSDVTGVCELNSLNAPTATDNCSGQVIGTTDVQLPITTQGTTTITWTYTDDNGNTTTQQQNIIISDDKAPVADLTELPVITTDCDGVVTQPNAPSATDNCAGAVVGTTNQVFPFTPTEGTQILWEYDDGNGNTSIQFQDIVIVESDAVTVEESLCEGAEFTFPDGTEWTGESSQVSTLTNQQGCDSLITTNITVLPLPEVDLGEDEVYGCVGEELTFSIDESAIEFETYTISTLFGNSSTDGPLTFEFNNTFAATSTTQDIFVTIELTSPDGCIGTDQVLLKDNTMRNWGIGGIQNNDPEIIVSNTILPETADSFEWNFGDGTLNSTDLNPTHTYTENGDYTITLTVSNECGDESIVTSVTITNIDTTVPLSVESDILVIYPNPTSEYLNVEMDQPVEISVYGLNGKAYISKTLKNNKSLDISQLPDGQYIVQLHAEGKLIKSEKIIKIN
ncbi:PKD domain-containing protein [Ekhidna sp.]|uniref:HYR-like domain-containing protein n=1 Tax=Ekhidna sp. TaxID=2608089 RepID=UPI003CCBEF4D